MMREVIQHNLVKLCAFAFGFLLCCIGSLSHANTAPGYIMSIQMTPAICMLDPSLKKKRKCLEGYSLNIQGLYPELYNRNCRTNSSAELSPLQAKVVARVMPDDAARQQLWRETGGCTEMNASQYFRTIINFADRLKVPAMMTGQQTQVVYENTLRSMFIRLNSGLQTNAIHFQCQKSGHKFYLTSVQICYGINGHYKSCVSEPTSNCPNSFTIKGSY
jgi:ribonuclease T2